MVILAYVVKDCLSEDIVQSSNENRYVTLSRNKGLDNFIGIQGQAIQY